MKEIKSMNKINFVSCISMEVQSLLRGAGPRIEQSFPRLSFVTSYSRRSIWSSNVKNLVAILGIVINFSPPQLSSVRLSVRPSVFTVSPLGHLSEILFKYYFNSI